MTTTLIIQSIPSLDCFNIVVLLANKMQPYESKLPPYMLQHTPIRNQNKLQYAATIISLQHEKSK